MSISLDRSSRKASIAARLILKKKSGQAYSVRDSRMAQSLKNDPAVTDRLIFQSLQYLEQQK